ncbi:MAG: hypothetical protein AABY10_01790 [Nanoarchaeota archaeon]
MQLSLSNFPKCKDCGSDIVPLYKKERDEESKADVESIWWRCSSCERVVE